MALFSMRLAGGGGFTTPLAAVRRITPAKKRGHAVVHVLWGAKHSRSKQAKGTGPAVQEMVVVGDVAHLRKRLARLRSAG